jgi:RND family efflux transporter MFP subunit
MSLSSTGKLVAVVAVVVLGGVGYWWWSSQASPPAAAGGAQPGRSNAPVSVTTTLVKQQSVPVTVQANGTVVALQAVDIRAQINTTVKFIHFKEGQLVKQGDLLFTFDNRTEEAALQRAQAQVMKSRGDSANAERNLQRQRDLFTQKFISPAGLDVAVNQSELAKGQLAVDVASLEVARVAKSLTEIRAPFAGRSGAINVRVGSLVQPNGSALVTISQLDPIGVAFSLPERELAFVQNSLSKGEVKVSAELPEGKLPPFVGKLTFVESAVDVASGTIPMKATFSNTNATLWPGMFVNVTIPTRVIAEANVVPIQAVQSGPERKFLYVVNADNSTTLQPIDVLLNQSGLAVISGVAAGTKVVVEGAQNVRPKGQVVEGGATGSGKAGKAGKAGKGGEVGTVGKADKDTTANTPPVAVPSPPK